MAAFMVLLSSILLIRDYQAGFYLLWFVSAMLALWGATNFCPSLAILYKLGIKSCSFRK
jgi:lipopolysaccharide export LptBFGC system permease protein LptF